MEEKKHTNIELRSEEVQEIMNNVPSWILRWGIVTLFIIVVVIATGTWFIKYPDVIQTEVVINSLEPPISTVARTSGKIDSIYVTNGEVVMKEQLLALIQNTASYADIRYLQSAIDKWEQSGMHTAGVHTLFRPDLALGTVQQAYATFLTRLTNYLSDKEIDYYKTKLNYQQQALADKENYLGHLQQQHVLVEEQFKLSKNIFDRDSILFVQEIITGNDYDVSRNNYLQHKQSILSSQGTMKQHTMLINSQKEALFDLRQKITETETMRKMELDNSFQALKTAMQSWEENYLIKTPISGTVNFMGIWNKNRHVTSGEEVFVIIPNNQDIPTAKAKLPVQGAGKVKEGQAVNVRITNFPDQEFGYLKGIVASISNTPTKDGFYVVDIRFPNGIVTNYNITLPISQQMHGTADIVTNDLRLFDRILMPMKKLLTNNETQNM